MAVLNADDAEVAKMRSRTRARVVTVGTRPDADIRAVDVSLDALSRASFTVETPTGRADVVLRLSGAHHVGNALAVTAAALECGMGLDAVATALSAARPTSRWRMEVHERADGVTVVNDAYNANPDSMRAALEALRAIGRGSGERRRTWAVLGEMLELGDLSRTEHERVGGWVAELGTDRLVVVGPGAGGIADGAAVAAGAATEVSRVADADAAYALLESELAPGDVVLLKSSRDAGLRWLGDRLVGIEVPA
jgi:UDP-N-acetylmuramoyl-tripeptide--D-alanyl-D-alanine ligase